MAADKTTARGIAGGGGVDAVGGGGSMRAPLATAGGGGGGGGSVEAAATSPAAAPTDAVAVVALLTQGQGMGLQWSESAVRAALHTSAGDLDEAANTLMDGGADVATDGGGGISGERERAVNLKAILGAELAAQVSTAECMAS